MKQQLIPIVTRILEGKAREIKVGDEIVIIAGRKIPLGTKADVFWKGPNKFQKDTYQLGLRLFNGNKVFTAEGNCEKVNVAPVNPDLVEEKTELGKYNFYALFAKLPIL